jgi:hypothetical protein
MVDERGPTAAETKSGACCLLACPLATEDLNSSPPTTPTTSTLHSRHFYTSPSFAPLKPAAMIANRARSVSVKAQAQQQVRLGRLQLL